LSIKSFLK